MTYYYTLTTPRHAYIVRVSADSERVIDNWAGLIRRIGGALTRSDAETFETAGPIDPLVSDDGPCLTVTYKTRARRAA